MFSIQIPFLHLEHMYKSNQVFNWIKIADNKFLILSDNEAVKVSELKNDRFVFDCTEEEFFSYWFDYFDLENDYSRMNWILKNLDGEIKIAANRFKGIRIIKQPIFESLIFSSIKSVFSIEISRQAINSLKRSCGKKHSKSFRESGKINWFDFPSAEEILEKESFLDNRSLMHQKDKIIEISKDIIDGWFDIEYLKSLDYYEAIDYLTSFDYLNEWSANFICLCCLGFLNSFLYDNHFSNFIKKCNMDFEEFKTWYLYDDEVKSCLGLLSQYVWSNEVYPVKNLEKWMKE